MEETVDGIRGTYYAELDEPETREEYLQRANLAASQEAPQIFLYDQQTIYGKSARIEWQARVDEAIEADAISVSEGENSVVITQGNLDTGLDPHDHRETPTNNIVRQAYDGLMRRDREGSIIAKVATNWERVEGGRARFQIREGVTFHNGDELTPADVAYSVNRVVDPETGIESPQRDQLAGVQSAEVVEGERAVDVLSDGANPIVFQLFGSFCDVVQRDWIEARGQDERNTQMNGTGPFQLTSYTNGEEVVFESYSDHWNGAPPVDQVSFRAAQEQSTRVAQLIEGETDIIDTVPAQDVSRVRDSSGAEVDPVGDTRVIFNQMRYDVEPFSDPQFRRALNYAIDIEGIVESVLQGFGQGLGQSTLPAFFGYNDDISPYPQDQELADQLIEDAGYAGQELTLQTPVGRYPNDVNVAEAIAGQVDQLETVSASVEQRDFGTLAGEVTDGEIETAPDWFLLGWGNTTFDASQTLIPLLRSDGLVSVYRNDDFDRLINEAQNPS
jgi:ABC-type dipeptide transport system, periplasmic component